MLEVRNSTPGSANSSNPTSRLTFSGDKKPDFSSISIDSLGFGFNVLDGRVKFQVFESLNVEYSPECTQETSQNLTSSMHHFRSYTDYEHELCNRVGIEEEKYHTGMWTLAVPPPTQPVTTLYNTQSLSSLGMSSLLSSLNSLASSSDNNNSNQSSGNNSSKVRSRSNSFNSKGEENSNNNSKRGSANSGVPLNLSGLSEGTTSSTRTSGNLLQVPENAHGQAPPGDSISPRILSPRGSLGTGSESTRGRSESIGDPSSQGSRSRSGSIVALAQYNQRLLYPFLCGIEKLDGYQHYIQEIQQSLYTLKINLPQGTESSKVELQRSPSFDTRVSTLMSTRVKREEERFVAGVTQYFVAKGVESTKVDLSFNAETKSFYYGLIERMGTHYISEITFGSKAEFRWSLQEKPEKDAISKMTKQQKYKKKFQRAVNLWSSQDLRMTEKNPDGTTEELKVDKKQKFPKHCVEAKAYTSNFFIRDYEEKLVSAKPIGFKLQEISRLFPTSSTTPRILRGDFEMAIQVYLEEMSPKRDASKIKDGDIISIFSLDNNSFVEVDDHGHLLVHHNNMSTNYCGTGCRIPPVCKFEVKKKGNKIGLKSLRFNKKLVSKAMTKSVFHFHRLQFMGPHESFEINGDHMLIGGNISASSFIYCNNSGNSNISGTNVFDCQIHHDGSLRRRAKFIFLDPTVRSKPEGDEDEDSIEPFYIEDDFQPPIQLEINLASENKEDNVTPVSPEQNARATLEAIRVPSDIGLTVPSYLKVAKSNSTSSLFLNDTILLPNIDQLTKGMANCLRYLIQEGHKVVKQEFIEIFSEEKFPLTRQVFNFNSVPSVETIYHFLNTIFKVEKLPAEPGIMCLIYMRRVLAKTGLTLHATNWRRVTLSTLILASKVWEDQAVWNVDFIELFPNITVQDLNRLEKFVLKFLEFNVSIGASEYVRVYFELREFTDAIDPRDPLAKPLDEVSLKQLEFKTVSTEKELAARKVKKTGSLAHIERKQTKSSRAVLS